MVVGTEMEVDGRFPTTQGGRRVGETNIGVHGELVDVRKVDRIHRRNGR